MSDITPSQTVGPFFAYGLSPHNRCDWKPNANYDWKETIGANLITPDATGTKIHIEGCITDGDGKVQEVRGEGVVGAQPLLKPGQDFEYTSWCMLATPHGSMRGTYQMVTPEGEQFDAEIAAFPLSLPYALN